VQLNCPLRRWPFGMPKFKVEFSNYAITLPEHGLDFPNVEAARKGGREIASKLRAEGVFMSGTNISDWHMRIMNADGTTVAEFPLEEHDDI
jgi:hypothetical protein